MNVKPKEEIDEVFITISIAKVDFQTDKENHTSLFKNFEKNINKKIVECHHVVMEFGDNNDNPHLHIYLKFKIPLNWTQINRLVKYPAKKSCNPLLWSKYSCKSKRARNVPYLLQCYQTKEKNHILLSEKNIDWKYMETQSNIWLKTNLHKLPLKLKHISIGQLPYRIKDFALHKKLVIKDYITFINVIEIMIQENKYNLFTMYRNSSLLRQTYNYIQILNKNKINYQTDYFINNDETIYDERPKVEQLSEKINLKQQCCRDIAKLELQIYNDKQFKNKIKKLVNKMSFCGVPPIKHQNIDTYDSHITKKQKCIYNFTNHVRSTQITENIIVQAMEIDG